ncbi:MAG TPA: carboxyl transferase domain-containing protein [Burkholderiales bacterium]|nr:carboxyl transferase domain-containing protein [Burkholderiales bacterium]
MSWEREVKELHERQARARELGGPERVARHKAAGKLTARERIDALLDPGSFREIGSIAGSAKYDEAGDMTSFTPAHLVMGRGTIEGKPVVVTSDDFTVRGGAAHGGLRDKHVRAEMMARDLRLPIVRLVDGTGGGGSVNSIEDEGYAKCPALYGFHVVVENLSLVPCVSLALGSTAGWGAAKAAVAHYSVMVKKTSQIFVAGPPVVNRLGRTYDKEELGGSAIHARNGTVDDEADSEHDAFARARRFLSYLPRSVHELPARTEPTDDPDRRIDWLLEAIPRDERQVYKMRDIVDAVVDEGSFFEIGRRWGRSIITGLARLDGWPVALLASDPYHYGGAWSADAARKIRRFVDLAQTFHLPAVHLVDCPGFMVGLEAEQRSTMRFASEAIAAILSSTIPWCAVVVRKCFGIGGGAHANNSRYALRYAWPSASWGSMPIAGGLEASYRSELAAAADPARKLAEIEQRLKRLNSPFRTAEAFNFDEIVDPRDTRRLLCEYANVAAGSMTPGAPSYGHRP